MAALPVKPTLPWPYGWLKTCTKFCLILQKQSKIYCRLKISDVQSITILINFREKRVFQLRQLIPEFLYSQDRILSMAEYELDHFGGDCSAMFSISFRFLPKASQDATQTRMTWAIQELRLQTGRNAKFRWVNPENFEVWSETRQSAIMAGGLTVFTRATGFKSFEGKWRSTSSQRCSSQTHHGWLVKALKSKADGEKPLRRYL